MNFTIKHLQVKCAKVNCDVKLKSRERPNGEELKQILLEEKVQWRIFQEPL